MVSFRPLREGVRRASPPTIRTALPRLRRRRASRACRATNSGDATAISQVPVGAAHQRMGKLGPIPRTCAENIGSQTCILAIISTGRKGYTTACMQVCGPGGRTIASLHSSARLERTYTCMHAVMWWAQFCSLLCSYVIYPASALFPVARRLLLPIRLRPPPPSCPSASASAIPA